MGDELVLIDAIDVPLMLRTLEPDNRCRKCQTEAESRPDGAEAASLLMTKLRCLV